MTDRGLLELAAKAAGITGMWDGAASVFVPAHGPIFWNPLTDDGDALRLAVKLQLEINVGTVATATGYDPKGEFCLSEPHGDDPYAATRRAIVRAAAEIGKTLV